MNETEEWKDVEHYPGYKISNLGRIKGKDGYLLKPYITTKGYRQVGLWRSEDGRKYLRMSRLVYQHFGEDEWNPNLTVDHMNHNTEDDCISNLRLISHSKNSSNQQLLGHYRGVRRHGNKWQSQITHKKEKIYLGSFDTELEAAQARDKYIIDNDLESDYELNDFSDL